jgi:hypothetical protein
MEKEYRINATLTTDPSTERKRATSMWRLSSQRAVVWCRDPQVWARVSRWSFGRPYAEAFVKGQLVERAFIVPRQREAWAAKQLGFPPIPRRHPTASQAAYHEQLRARAARGERFGADLKIGDAAADTSETESAPRARATDRKGEAPASPTNRVSSTVVDTFRRNRRHGHGAVAIPALEPVQ